MKESVTNLTKNHPEYCMEDAISSEKDWLIIDPDKEDISLTDTLMELSIMNNDMNREDEPAIAEKKMTEP